MHPFFTFVLGFYLLPAFLAACIIAYIVREEGVLTIDDLFRALKVIFVPIINWVMVLAWVWDKLETRYDNLISKINFNKVLWRKK